MTRTAKQVVRVILARVWPCAPMWLVSLLALSAIAISGGGCGSGDSAPGGEGAQGASGSSHEGGGEKSIEEFGSEAQGPTRAAILTAERGYLTALVVGDPAKACFRLSAEVRTSLRQVAGARRGGRGCVDLLPMLLAPSAAGIARGQADGEVTKVRVEGDRAFVVFRAPGAKLYQFTMDREGGDWKVDTVAASVLVPSTATLAR